MISYDFHFTRFEYKPNRGAPSNIPWPPPGLHLQLLFKPPATSRIGSFDVIVNYEIFDDSPILTKWITVVAAGKSASKFKVAIRNVEILSLNHQWAAQGYNWLQVVPDQPRGTKVDWSNEENSEPGSFQPMLQVAYDRNFSLALEPGGSMTSFKALEVLVGSSDPERSGLSLRRLKRLLAPQSQENPIYFHMTNGSSSAFRKAVDQLVQAGFEMIFYSFGSGFDLEAEDLSQLKEDIAYANARGIEVGGYDLIAWTRQVPDRWRAVTNETGPSACFASGWYDYLLDKVKRAIRVANLTAIETDGPYPGYSCSASDHEHHSGISDSTYQQARLQAEFYIELHKLGMYVNQPDDYFFFGANKAGRLLNTDGYLDNDGEPCFFFPTGQPWATMKANSRYLGGWTCP